MIYKLLSLKLIYYNFGNKFIGSSDFNSLELFAILAYLKALLTKIFYFNFLPSLILLYKYFAAGSSK